MIKSFPLTSRSEATALKKPKELFSYARDKTGQYELDSELAKQNHLSYFYFPDSYIERGIDLQAGFASFKKIPEEENLGDFDKFLEGIMRYEQESGSRLNVDIITFRGLMTRLLVLPYNLKDPVNFKVAVFDDQIFIQNDNEVELARRKEQQSNDVSPKNDYTKRCEYSGYKFEKVTTLPKIWADSSRSSIEGRTNLEVNNYEQYISAVRTGIGSVKVLLAGEVDCIWDYYPDKDVVSHYVELKTTNLIETPGNLATFEKKLFKAWAQSFLVGARRIVYGFRDRNFILKNVELYSTEEIPLMLKNSINQNQKIICMNALKWYGAILEWLVREIPKDSKTVWNLTYDPSTQTMYLQEVIDPTQSIESMIPESFRNWRSQLAAATYSK